MAGFEAVIFDMDGTLIEPLLDFQALRKELGISPRNGILEAIEMMPATESARAGKKLLEAELAAVQQARLMPQAKKVLRWIRQAGLTTALLTRNAEAAMKQVLQKFFAEDKFFDLTWSRENGPIKPEPEGILRACRQLGAATEKTCCVGDFHYDIVAANAAGAVSVLLDPSGRCEYADQADHVIRRLDELIDILEI